MGVHANSRPREGPYRSSDRPFSESFHRHGVWKAGTRAPDPRARAEERGAALARPIVLWRRGAGCRSGGDADRSRRPSSRGGAWRCARTPPRRRRGAWRGGTPSPRDGPDHRAQRQSGPATGRPARLARPRAHPGGRRRGRGRGSRVQERCSGERAPDRTRAARPEAGRRDRPRRNPARVHRSRGGGIRLRGLRAAGRAREARGSRGHGRWTGRSDRGRAPASRRGRPARRRMNGGEPGHPPCESLARSSSVSNSSR